MIKEFERNANGEIILPKEVKKVIRDYIQTIDFRRMDKMLRNFLMHYLSTNNGDQALWFDEAIEQLEWLFLLNDIFEDAFVEYDISPKGDAD